MTMTHIHVGNAIVCREELEEIKRELLGERWCFQERKRRDFFYVLTAPVGLSYYGPTLDVRCGTCGRMDADLFPGYSREWEG